MAQFFKRVGMSLFPEHIEWLEKEAKRIQREERRGKVGTSEVVRRLVEKEQSFPKYTKPTYER